jgi:hypothetical protein
MRDRRSRTPGVRKRRAVVRRFQDEDEDILFEEREIDDDSGSPLKETPIS